MVIRPPPNPNSDIIENLRAKNAKLEADIGALERDNEDLDETDVVERKYLARNKLLIEVYQLDLAIAQPQLAIVAEDPANKDRVKDLNWEYELAWRKKELYHALRDPQPDQENIVALRQYIKDLKKQKAE